MKKVIVMATACIMALFVFVGCSNSSAYAGDWKAVQSTLDGQETDLSGIEMVLTLKDDGTLTIHRNNEEIGTGTYTVDGTTLNYTIDEQTSVGQFSEDGQTLTISADNATAIYQKQ